MAAVSRIDAIVTAQSPFELLTLQAALWPDKPLLILPDAVRRLWQLEAHVWTYAETLAETHRVAEAYRAQGYGPGHRVALLYENRPHHFFHWLALNSLGVSVVPLNPDYTGDESAYVLGHSATCLVMVAPACRNKVEGAAARVGIPVVDDLATLPAAPPVQAPHVSSDESECVLAYTSGTTGKPKGCLLSNRYFLGWGEWYVAQQGYVRLQPGRERLITPLPTFHVNAMGNSFMGMLAAGGAQVIVDRFHPRSWLAMARETEATCFHYLGVMPAMLMALPASEDDRRHTLRFGLGGGAHPEHHRAFENRFGVPLLEGWTMTETGGALLLCAVDEPRHIGTRCLGRPDRAGPPLAFRIVGDHGSDVPFGSPGEFLVRAGGADPRRGLFSGYLNDAEATANAWADGWLHTGDIVRQGDDGSLHFVERKKNIIRRSGENIAAIEVEGVLAGYGDVAQVAVVPTPDPLREEEVVAVVVLQDGVARDAATAESLLVHAAAHLAYYKLPAYVVFVDALPTTATGKLRKSDLLAFAAEPLAQTNSHDLRTAKSARRLRQNH